MFTYNLFESDKLSNQTLNAIQNRFFTIFKYVIFYTGSKTIVIRLISYSSNWSCHRKYQSYKARWLCFSFLWWSLVWQYRFYCVHLFSSCASSIYTLHNVVNARTRAHTHTHSRHSFHLSAISFCLWPIYHPRALFCTHFYTELSFRCMNRQCASWERKESNKTKCCRLLV